MRSLLLFACALIIENGLGASLPVVDPGLFMIYGVETCRNGSGYCLLGIDCTLDDDFAADDSGGNCDGLKSAFTPPATFTCCQLNQSRFNAQSTTSKIPHDTSQSTTESFLEMTIINTTDEIGLSETEPGSRTDETVTQPSNVFVDLNNEVFKEVIPPVWTGGENNTLENSNVTILAY